MNAADIQAAVADGVRAALSAMSPALKQPEAAPPAPAASDWPDEEQYQRFKARLIQEVPMGGGTVNVLPPEKLRRDFQKQEADRIIAAAGELTSLAKRVLKLLESTDGEYVSQQNVAKRLGVSNTGQGSTALKKAITELTDLGFVETMAKQGSRKSLRRQIAADLEFYKPSEADIDAVYQNVLFAVATED